jgi:hypothetical protein
VGAGVFVPLLVFCLLLVCRGNVGVRISPHFPCPDRQGCRAGFGNILLWDNCGTKRAALNWEKLRSASGAIFDFLSFQGFITNDRLEYGVYEVIIMVSFW